MNELSKYILKKDSIFMPYISLGDPSYDLSIKWAEAISPNCDILELGIPFSDPVADGPVIQKSYKRALDNQIFSMDTILETTKKIYEIIQKPIVYITYLNPVISYGLEIFFKNAYNSGVRGIVIPDLPFDTKEYLSIFNVSQKNNISIINLITPASSKERIKSMKKYSTGFIYYVTSFGVTGSRIDFDSKIEERIKMVKDVIKIPVFAGFGISEAEQAKKISAYSDGIIIGSKIQKIIEEESKDPTLCSLKLSQYTHEIKNSLIVKKNRNYEIG